MTGETLKLEIMKRGYTLKDIAKAMSTSPQNLSGKLASDNITTGLLEQVAEIMGVDVIEFYGHTSGDSISAKFNSTAFKGNPTYDPRLLDILQSRDKQLENMQKQLNHLIDVIEEQRVENRQLVNENAMLKARLSMCSPTSALGENS